MKWIVSLGRNHCGPGGFITFLAAVWTWCYPSPGEYKNCFFDSKAGNPTWKHANRGTRFSESEEIDWHCLSQKWMSWWAIWKRYFSSFSHVRSKLWDPFGRSLVGLSGKSGWWASSQQCGRVCLLCAGDWCILGSPFSFGADFAVG